MIPVAVRKLYSSRSPVRRSRPSKNTTRPEATASPVSVLTSARSASRRGSPRSISTPPSPVRSRSPPRVGSRPRPAPAVGARIFPSGRAGRSAPPDVARERGAEPPHLVPVVEQVEPLDEGVLLPVQLGDESVRPDRSVRLLAVGDEDRPGSDGARRRGGGAGLGEDGVQLGVRGAKPVHQLLPRRPRRRA